MLRLAAIFVLMGLACFARADAIKPTPVRDIARLGPDAQFADFCVTGTVIYCDPGRRCLVLQDGDHGLLARIPLESQPLKPGDRAQLRGKLQSRHFIDATETRLVDTDPLPEALPINGQQFLSGKALNRRVCLTGVIRGGEGDDDYLVFQLFAGRQSIRTCVRDLPAGPLRWGRYVDAEVCVTGVCAPVVDAAGRIDGIHVLVHSLDDVVITRPAPEQPFAVPLTPLAAVPSWADHRARVSGVAAGPVTNGELTLEGGGHNIRVGVQPGMPARRGERFEAIGFPTLRDGLPFLDSARIRGYATRRGVHPDGATPSELLPVIDSVTDIRRMPADEVARGHPVRLQGIVTFHLPADGELFVHDGTEGIFVYAPKEAPRITPGATVIVEGHSDPGEFAPSIRAEKVTLLRPGRLPNTRRYGYEELVGGREDCQWVEIEAVVRGTSRGDHGEAFLMLRFGPATYPAKIAGTDPETLRPLFGATVRVRATCGTQFNARRQWNGLLFYVPSAAAIEVRRPATPDRAAVPTHTVESLTHFDPDRGLGEPVKLSGMIISRRSAAIVLQDATGGIAVDLQPRQAGTVGDTVEVRGFLVWRGNSWALEDGLTRLVSGESDAALIHDVTPGQVAAGGFGATLIRVEGLLVDQFPAGESDHVFLLRSLGTDEHNHLFFPAVIPRHELTPELQELRPGTRLRVVGACAVPNEKLMISAFRIVLRDANDVEVVERPPWWTPRKALVVAAAIGTLAALPLVWVITLRRRARSQTEQIRRRLEREAHLEAQYRDLFESASDAVFTLDASGGVTAMNLAGRKLTGLTVGDSFLNAVTPGSSFDARELLVCDEPMTREIGLARPEGVALLEVSSRPILNAGASAGVQAIARDLTHRRRLEAELRQSQKMEAIGRLAGGVAHDFNNLLTVINGNAEVLRNMLPRGDTGLADEIVRAGEQAAALTRQLLTFSRKGVVTPKLLYPNETIEIVRKMLARLVGERVEVVTDLDEAVGTVKIDPALLEQALLNLAVNARDAMPHGGKLTLRTCARPRHVRIEVVDTGVGMDAVTKARIFEPFFTTKPAGEGTGLGLATVKSIVEQAGGTIAVQSESGRGATFAIELPLCDESPAPSSPSADTPVPAANREVILLVEDEPAVQLLERRVLEMGGYEVLVASSGEEALKILDQHVGRVDLLVTDVVMPGMTGRELAEAVAQRRAGLRALFLSGYTPDEVLRQGVRAEEAYFLQKPFTPSALLSKVREVLLRTGSSFPPPPSSFGKSTAVVQKA
jgi:PAS domain S-box-containing protein